MSKEATFKHIALVRKLMGRAISALVVRAVKHDDSKLRSPEVEIFEEFTPKLAGSTYGSEEYEGFRKAMKPALDHHYAHNSHHPEHAYVKDEDWKAVTGYEERYEVSSFGRVRAMERLVVRPGPTGNMKRKEKMLRLQKTPKGYFRVSLSKGGKSKNFMVHRLVADAFLTNPNSLPEVNHLDGDKKNNRVGNLEWVTTSQNQLHAYKTELKHAKVKYFVQCVELDLVTPGCLKMERLLRSKGYEQANAASIYGAMDSGHKHLDLTFIGHPISQGSPHNMLATMSLLDLLEMICDWKAATARHNDGDILKSIEINQKRFGYDDNLKKILLNTAKELGFLNDAAPSEAPSNPDRPVYPRKEG